MPEFWFKRGVKAWLLVPISLLYYLLTGLRRRAYRRGWLAVWQAPVPVVVVGNITAGGAGKTPLTIALVEALVARGLSVAVVSRGYGGAEQSKPLLLDSTTRAAIAGDEPVLIHESTGVPVCVFPKRVDAVKTLLQSHSVEVILCDDGLQHYALGRDIEIAVVNTDTLFGNRLLMPAGPLREPVSRLASVDYVVRNERAAHLTAATLVVNDSPIADMGASAVTYSYTLETVALCRLDGKQRIEVASANCQEQLAELFTGRDLVAKPAIANPERFFSFLQSLGLVFRCEAKPDHHKFSANDFSQQQDMVYLITEKDKVKCRDLQIDTSRIWYSETAVMIDKKLIEGFVAQLHDIMADKSLS